MRPTTTAARSGEGKEKRTLARASAGFCSSRRDSPLMADSSSSSFFFCQRGVVRVSGFVHPREPRLHGGATPGKETHTKTRTMPAADAAGGVRIHACSGCRSGERAGEEEEDDDSDDDDGTTKACADNAASDAVKTASARILPVCSFLCDKGFGCP